MLFLVDEQHQNGFNFRVAIEKSASDGLRRDQKERSDEKKEALRAVICN